MDLIMFPAMQSCVYLKLADLMKNLEFFEGFDSGLSQELSEKKVYPCHQVNYKNGSLLNVILEVMIGCRFHWGFLLQLDCSSLGLVVSMSRGSKYHSGLLHAIALNCVYLIFSRNINLIKKATDSQLNMNMQHKALLNFGGSPSSQATCGGWDNNQPQELLDISNYKYCLEDSESCHNFPHSDIEALVDDQLRMVALV